MERPVFKPVGTPVEELDTPALVVDLDALEYNIEVLHGFFREADANVRPHVEAHRCPAIAHKQMAAGGTAGGISVTTVGEAEVFAQSGFADILIASEIVTSAKINRLCALAKQVGVTVAVDNPRNVADLSDAAQRASVTLRAVVDIHTGGDLCGVEPGQPAVDLARAVSGAAGLRFAGLMTYEGKILAEEADSAAEESRKWVQQVLDTREMVEKAGMPVEVVSAGGTHNYEMVGAMAGVTEVPAGSYPLMDYPYCQYRSGFTPAARVMSTVTSVPDRTTAITDSGQKAMGIDLGLPVVEDVPGVKLARMSAEHGILDLTDEGQKSVDLGDKIWLTPWDIANCVNVYDYIQASRNGKLEAVWSVAARGHYR